MKLKNFNWIIILFLLLPLYQSCGVYSMTGASISPDVKTISINRFINNASLGPTNLSNLFTNELRDYFQQNTSLILVPEGGDLQFDGFISDYTISPIGANATGNNNTGNLSSLSEIRITISCTYTNVKDPTYDFDKKFTNNQTFNSSENLSANEEEYVQLIFEKIINDIFNSSVGNW